MDTFNIGIEKGRELVSGDTGVVLGYNYMFDDKIFPKGYSLGDKIEIQGKKLKVLGFYEEVGSPQDDAQVYVTDDMIKELYPNETLSYNWIVAKVDVLNIDKVVSNIEKNLRKERNVEEGKEDFFVQSFLSYLDSYTNILNIVVGFIILIAFISVLVSAVNTANTMIT